MDSITSIGKSLMPFAAIGLFVFVGYWIKLILDKNNNVKKAEGHVWVQIIPIAGNEHNYMVPIDMSTGTGKIQIPDTKGKITNSCPTHILGDPGQFNAIWPPGKPKFTQLSVQKITYFEGDAEPASNRSDRPVISSQTITDIIDGVGTNTEDAVRRSLEQSSGTQSKKANPFMWIYIILIAVGIMSIVNIVLSAQGMGAKEAMEKLSILVRQALGLP